MATEKSPDQPAVITTTTVTSHTTTTKQMKSSSGVGIQFDKSFAKSPQGVLALIEAFYSFVAFVIIAASDRQIYKSGSFAFFMTVTFIVFFFTMCYYIGEVTNLRYKLQLPWTILDMWIYSIYILTLLISSSLVAANGYLPNHGAGATLGFVVMQLYMISLVLTIMQFRANQALNQQSTGAMGVDNTANTIGAGAAPDNFYNGPGPAY
ncbi:MARVEL domain-containing protein 1-like [Lytechinus variegatus]|uniref:MARVEL domain-containing protein 1-like n=1 Tax=Lytechinus variegatus TaxID=7654 RepID=UPI001BB1D9C7|nr:MARVEL domain-containing protein 1-like [Lytechinus variegatus]XP_041462433.1 MARVEL domain-containing protein 1-like [Lytechinus variegatus]XP_041462435.1 MARVEL domain-containing protein 1-like [Lytechinus variegatus]